MINRPPYPQPRQAVWRHPLSTISEASEASEASDEDAGPDPVSARLHTWVDIGESGRLSPDNGDFAVSPGQRVESDTERAVQAQLDALLGRFPSADPALLRGSFLSRLQQTLARTMHRLDQPAWVDELNAELALLAPELERLLQPQAGLTPQEQEVLAHLERSVMDEALDRFGLPRDEHADAARAGLRQAARTLVAKGIDTPERVDRLLAQGLRHDYWLQVCMGSAGQAGYAGGFALFNRQLAPALAPRLLGRGLLPALAFGGVAGALVGLCDVLASAGAQRVADGLSYQAPGTANTAAQAMTATELRRIAGLAGIAAGTTFAKNFVLRTVVLTLLIETLAPEGMERGRRGDLDFAFDAGGGFFAGALAAHLRYTLLDSAQSHAFKLLCGEDLASRIDRMQRPLQAGDFATALKLFAEGVGQAAIAPSTYVVVLAAVAPMIGLLVAAQNAVPPGLGTVGRVLAGGAIQALGPDLSSALAGPAPLPVQGYENAVRAGISSVMMAVMAGAACAAGNAAAPRLDGPALREWLGRAFAAVSDMRWMTRAGAAAVGFGDMPRQRRASSQ